MWYARGICEIIQCLRPNSAVSSIQSIFCKLLRQLFRNESFRLFVVYRLTESLPILLHRPMKLVERTDPAGFSWRRFMTTVDFWVKVKDQRRRGKINRRGFGAVREALLFGTAANRLATNPYAIRLDRTFVVRHGGLRVTVATFRNLLGPESIPFHARKLTAISFANSILQEQSGRCLHLRSDAGKRPRICLSSLPVMVVSHITEIGITSHGSVIFLQGSLSTAPGAKLRCVTVFIAVVDCGCVD